MRLSTLLLLLGLVCKLGTAAKCPKQKTSPGREILCYTSSFDVELLSDPICRCTTLVHQGHELHNLSTSEVESLQKSLKEINPVLQVVVSIKDPRGTLRTSAATRREAAARLARVLSEVDGVELDMTAGSKERLTHFVKGLKDEMVRKSNEKRILLALPTNTEELAKQFEIKALSKYVDLFTISTHYLIDKNEAFNTFHPSRLMGLFDMLNTDSLIDLVSGLGAPKRKLLVSLPASAYRFTLTNKNENAPRSPTKEEEPIAISRKELCELMSEGEWTVERDEDLTAPYTFKDDTWIAFEDKTSVGIKGKYALLRELAGLGIWNVENDLKNDCGKPVTHEVYHSFTDMKRKTRGAVLSSLENDFHHVQIPYSTHVKSSGFRIVRVVDTDGHIHAIRENTQTEFICTRQGYFVHPKSCNRFYRCVKFNQGVDDYSVFEFDCPAGLAFDERTEVCVWPGSLPEGSPCPGSSEIAPVPRARFQCPDHPGYYADPQNCRWFFACFDLGEPELTAYEFRCPFGLVFDEKKLICEWPWLVPGCAVSGYSRTEYGNVGYGIGAGGYAAGAAGSGSSSGYSGSDDGTSGLSGSGGAGHLNAGGAGYSGSAGGRYSGSGGLGYSGSAGTGHFGASGSRYSGLTNAAGAGQSDLTSDGFSGSSGYSGSTGGKLSGVGGIGLAGASYSGVVGAGGAGYSGNLAGAGHFDASTVGYSSSSGAGHSAGTGYSGSIGVGHSGESEAGYSGAAGAGISAGAGYSGSNAAAGYSGSVGSGISSDRVGYSGLTGAGHSGSAGAGISNIGAGFSGTLGAGSSGSSGAKLSTISGTRYSGLVNAGHAGAGGYSGVDTAEGGYSGTLGSGYSSGSGSKYAGATESRQDAQTVYVGSAGEAGADSSSFIDDGSHTIGSLSPGLTLVDSGLGTTGGAYVTTSAGLHSGTAGNGVVSSGTTTFHGNAGLNGGYLAHGTGAGSIGIANGKSTSSGTTTYHGTTYGGAAGNGKHTVSSGTTIYHGNAGATGSYAIDNGANQGLDLSAGKAGTATYYGNGGLTGGYVVGGATHGLDLSTGAGVVTSGTKTYYGNVGSPTGSYTFGIGSTDGLDLTAGKGTASLGTTTYYGNIGSSNGRVSGEDTTGANVHGAIVTNDYTTGTLLTHGDVSGTVLTGTANQGAVITGISEPGFVKTVTDTPGYVMSDGVKTIYEGSTASGALVHGTAAPGVLVSGTPAPAVILKGDSSPGVLLAGHTSSGVSIGGTVQPSVVVEGSTAGNAGTVTYYGGGRGSSATGGTYASTIGSTKNTNVPVYYTDYNKDAGYKTNEYHDNGGRGTIRYNNGYITSKFAESDLQDYRPSYATLPDSVVSGGRIEGSGGLVLDTNLPGVGGYITKPAVGGAYTRGGFTKTGATKTGITTAQLGGSATYVIGPGQPRPRPNPDNIGVKAFEGNVGYTSGPTLATNVNDLAYVTSTVAPDLGYVTSTESSHIDTSKITLGPASPKVSSGYTYSKPAVQLSTGGATGFTATPISTVYPETYLGATTPSPHLNVEVYNAPSVVTAAPVTSGSPAFVNTHSYVKPAGVEYKETLYQAAKIPVAPVIPTVRYEVPAVVSKQFTVSPTVAPVAYTTGPLENYKTTFYEAAKLPAAISSIQPVIDTGYKTVVSPTVLPISVSTGRYTYKDSRFQTDSLSTAQPAVDADVTYEEADYKTGKEYVSVTTPAPVSTVDSGYSYSKPRRPFRYRGPVSTVAPPTVTYEQPAVTVQQQVRYVPVSTTGPAVGVTYRKPFSTIGITYNQPTLKPVSTPVPIVAAEGYSYSKPSVQFVSTTTRPYYNVKSTDFIGSTVVPLVGGSPTNLNIPRSEVRKLITNYDRGTVRYTPNVYDVYTGDTGPKYIATSGPAVSNEYYGKKSSVAAGQTRVSGTVLPVSKTVTPSVTTYFNSHSTGHPTTPLYEVSTTGPLIGGTSRGKVIVKLSDLHPLLLGKLGAQCTCRADPFATIRGPGRKSLPIQSSNGPIDLANYDESDVYVDLETDQEPKQGSVFGHPTTYVSSTLSPVVVSSYKTPAASVFGVSSLKPSSTYLPVSSTPSPSVLELEGRTFASSGSSYVFERDFDSVPAASNRADTSIDRDIGPGVKSGKSLGTFATRGTDGFDATRQGSSSDCARPGLFRHPKYCNKFYACHWDEWKKRYTLHVFDCPVHLSFDSNAGACNWPTKGPACQNDNLLV